MGLFSIYVGLIYNECFSVAVPLFSSAWKFLGAGDTAVPASPPSQGYVYPLGVDPAWRGTKTELAFTNSLKMKLSIVLGVVHMLAGVTLSAFNVEHFRRRSELYTCVLPRFLFMFSLFGYLALLIIIKWCVNWSDPIGMVTVCLCIDCDCIVCVCVRAFTSASLSLPCSALLPFFSALPSSP